MCSEKRLLEGKCNTCLQVYEGLLLLYRCWLLRGFLALPFSRATDIHLPELHPLQEWINLTCPPQYSPPSPSVRLHSVPHLTLIPICPLLPHPTFPQAPSSQALLLTHTELSLPRVWSSLLPTPNSTHILSTYCVSGTVLNVLLKSTSFVFQMKIPMPKKNKVISPSS